VNAASVPSLADTAARAMLPRARLASALVLAPPVVATIWFGAPLFDLMVIAGAFILSFEWWRLCGEGSKPAAAATIGGVVGAPALAAFGYLPLAFTVIAIATALLLIIARRPLFAAAAPFYLGLPCALLIWLRADPVDGREAVLWLFIVVWASDIGAYIFGRAIGGPRLAPAISPQKTWAGALGGLLLAGAAGGVAALAFGHHQPMAAIALGLLFSLVAQLGDLGESWVKRRFGVKDSGTLIPGHGGLLDRVDALLLSAAAMALLTAVRNGSIVAWM
jgi:phosphatidate cytidylyltransferase